MLGSIQTGEADLATRMNNALDRAAAQFGNPGIQVVAMRDGQLLWSANRGMAILDPPVPVTDDTMFYFASFGKLMLAAFALHQVEAGRLDLDQPIAAYLGDEVPGSLVVTIRMLLTHTAGYPDMYSDPAVTPLIPPGGPGIPGGSRYDPNKPFTFSMLAAGLRDPVDPGVRFEYSNAAFFILARVLSKTAGGDDALCTVCQHFMQPAGTVRPMSTDLVTMQHSQRALRRFAHGYAPQKDGSLLDFFTAYGANGIPKDLYGLPIGDGLFAGTALGGAQFLDALFVRRRLLLPATVREMITSTEQAATSPERDNYGMGTWRTMAGGRSWQGHSGTYVGFTSKGATDIERGVTIMLVTNRSPAGEAHPATEMWQAVAEACSAGNS